VGGLVVGDVDGDMRVDMIVADSDGQVTCFDINSGNTKWEQRLPASTSEVPQLGDVDGDGTVDVVICTLEGAIYALHGNTGAVLSNFPVFAEGAITAPALLLNLNRTASIDRNEGLHIVVHAADGFLYIVSGTTGCYEIVDIGGESRAMVLADDLTGRGTMNLVVVTTSGHVVVLDTDCPYHPLRAWPRRFKSVNCATANENFVGVFVAQESRDHRDVRGDRFKLMVTIVDRRLRRELGIYTIAIFVGSREILAVSRFIEPRTVSLELHSPINRLYGTVRVVMSTNDGLLFEDSVTMSFNVNYLETVKFLVLIPFLLVCGALWFVRKDHELRPLRLVYRSERYGGGRWAYVPVDD